MPVVGEVEEIRPDLGRPQEFGGLAEMSGEAGDAVDVGLDRLGLEAMEGHVVDHALSQGSHGQLLSQG